MKTELISHVIDQMEPVRDLREQVENFKRQIEKLNKMLDVKKEILDKRNKILTLMNADLENLDKTPSNDSLSRIEGYYSYITSYKLTDLMEEGNWVVGVILSAAILEDVGKRRLKREFKGKIDSKRIENLKFEETIMMLFASRLVTPKIYQKLMDIKKVRNDLAHDSHKAMSIFLQIGSSRSKECQECKSAIKKAIFCLKTIYPPRTPD
jgi:hypothetical protein